MLIIYPPRFGGFLVVLVRARMLRMVKYIIKKRKTPSLARGFEYKIKQKLSPRYEKYGSLCCEIHLHKVNILIFGKKQNFFIYLSSYIRDCSMKYIFIPIIETEIYYFYSFTCIYFEITQKVLLFLYGTRRPSQIFYFCY